MKLEHCGRYLYACDFLSLNKADSVIDVACSNGYGSYMLSKKMKSVIAIDRNSDYLESSYLNKDNIKKVCMDLDIDIDDNSFDQLSVDSIVCFETIEHLKRPFDFLERFTGYIRKDGMLILSFPNSLFERFNPDGTNRDPFHLHVFEKDAILKKISELGFEVESVLGQPITNEICSIQHDLKEKELIDQEIIDRSFNYDYDSIVSLSRLLAYPDINRIDSSYSYIIVSRKKYK